MVALLTINSFPFPSPHKISGGLDVLWYPIIISHFLFFQRERRGWKVIIYASKSWKPSLSAQSLPSSTQKIYVVVMKAICRLRDQRVKEHSCLWNYSKSCRRTFSETNNKFILSFVKLLCLLSFEVCFCRDILPSFCLVRLCTSASNGIPLNTLLVSRIRILSFCLLVDLLTRAF